MDIEIEVAKQDPGTNNGSELKFIKNDKNKEKKPEESSESEEDDEQEGEETTQNQKDQQANPSEQDKVADKNKDGVDVGKKKKKKKKKKREQVAEETDYEVDIPSKAKTSMLLRCEAIPEHMRMRYAIIEANPWLLIVSNLSPFVTSYEIKDFFNALISKLRPEFAQQIPVVNVDIATNKQFSTLQFQNKQAKAYTLTLKGIELQKCKLIIEKPKQYFYRLFLENSRMELDVQVDCEEGAAQQLQMNKVYLGGLPTYLKDVDVRKLAETFGKLRYFNVAKQLNENKEQVSKGYCFFEFEDPAVTDKAIKALNGLPCGDRKLKVSRVTKDQNKLANNLQIQSEKGKLAPSNNSGSFLGGCDLIKREDIIKMLTIPEYAYTPSRVIQLLNMVSIEDLFEDDIYDELYQDVMAECSKISQVEKIEIPRPDKETGLCPPSIGKVFVKFMYIMKAKKARHILGGRTYNKRTVIASFYPEEKFERKDFLVSIQ